MAIRGAAGTPASATAIREPTIREATASMVVSTDLVGAPKDRSRMASAVSGAASGVVVSACLQPLVSR